MEENLSEDQSIHKEEGSIRKKKVELSFSLPEEVKTVKDLIMWEAAKFIVTINPPAKEKDQYLERLFTELRSGQRDLKEEFSHDLMKDDALCIFCHSEEDLSEDTVIALRNCRDGKNYGKIHICNKCKIEKGDKDLLTWKRYPDTSKIPEVAFKKYLVMLYLCCECKGELLKDLECRKTLGELSGVLKEPCSEEQIKKKEWAKTFGIKKRSMSFLTTLVVVFVVIAAGIGLALRLVQVGLKSTKEFSAVIKKVYKGMPEKEFFDTFRFYEPKRHIIDDDGDIITYEDYRSADKEDTVTFYIRKGKVVRWQK